MAALAIKFSAMRWMEEIGIMDECLIAHFACHHPRKRVIQ